MIKTRLLRTDELERLQGFLSKNVLIEEIIAAIDREDGRAFLVGGAVRDIVIGSELKDIDIEVHGLELPILTAILKKYGDVFEVGKAFGVLRLSTVALSDWSLPRSDGAGRRPRVTIDPHMGIAAALRRRDLTMNALAIDLVNKELIDPFDGLTDIQERVVRCVDPEIFIEDPLRLFRVMHFVGRFEMVPDEILDETCRVMDIRGVSRERIEEEFKKLLLFSQRPSLGIRWLSEVGRLGEVLPELAATIGIRQNPRWHPEGDVFVHTMQVLDAAAQTDDLAPEHKLVLMYAALCHDLGKVVATRMENGALRSHGHEMESVPLAKRMLRRLVGSNELVDQVVLLVRHHMSPASFIVNGARLPAYKRLAIALAPHLSLAFLARLFSADLRGRNGDGGLIPLEGPMPVVEAFLARAAEAGVLNNPEPALLKGGDLKGLIGVGPQLGAAVKRAYEIQINEGVSDRDKLKERVCKELAIPANFVKE